MVGKQDSLPSELKLTRLPVLQIVPGKSWADEVTLG